MSSSREHCINCIFGNIPSAQDDVTVRRERYLVTEGIFASGDRNRQYSLKQFGQELQTEGFDDARIAAAGVCVAKHLSSECDY